MRLPTQRPALRRNRRLHPAPGWLSVPDGVVASQEIDPGDDMDEDDIDDGMDDAGDE